MLVVATITTNIAANVVSAANSFSNLAPSRISARAGGVAAAAIGVVLFPWLLLDRYQTWLISYSGLLGAVGGVVVCDYLLVRRGRLNVGDLYRRSGIYGYGGGGVNNRAIVATVAGAVVALAGKLVPGLEILFNGSWFSAGGVAFLVYFVLMRRDRARVDVNRAAGMKAGPWGLRVGGRRPRRRESPHEALRPVAAAQSGSPVLALLPAVRGEVHQAQGRARRQRAIHHDLEPHGHAPRRAAPLRHRRHDHRRDPARVALRARRRSSI